MKNICRTRITIVFLPVFRSPTPSPIALVSLWSLSWAFLYVWKEASAYASGWRRRVVARRVRRLVVSVRAERRAWVRERQRQRRGPALAAGGGAAAARARVRARRAAERARARRAGACVGCCQPTRRRRRCGVTRRGGAPAVAATACWHAPRPLRRAAHAPFAEWSHLLPASSVSLGSAGAGEAFLLSRGLNSLVWVRF